MQSLKVSSRKFFFQLQQQKSLVVICAHKHKCISRDLKGTIANTMSMTVTLIHVSMVAHVLMVSTLTFAPALLDLQVKMISSRCGSSKEDLRRKLGIFLFLIVSFR